MGPMLNFRQNLQKAKYPKKNNDLTKKILNQKEISMKHIKTLLLLWCCLITGSAIDAATPKKEWTVLIYIAGDNDLYPYVSMNIEQLKRVGSSSLVNFVVYLCKHPHGQRKVAQKIKIEKGKAVILSEQADVDSGSPLTLLEALNWATGDFPAEHYAVIAWDHGSGALNRIERGICYDYTTGHYLSDRDLRYAFDHVVKKLGKKIDVFACDACLMASVELAASFANCVDYFVSSEETIPGTGFNYSRAMLPLAQHHIQPSELAMHWVKAYQQNYSPYYEGYTLSAVDLNTMNELTKAIDSLGNSLITLLRYQFNKSVKSLLQQCSMPGYCTTFEESTYIDLDHFAMLLDQKIDTVSVNLDDIQKNRIITQIKYTLTSIRSILAKSVIANAHGKKYAHAAGLTIYFPQRMVHASYPKLIWSYLCPSWSDFLEAYVRS